MAIEPNTNQTRAVKKAQSRPSYVQVGFLALALATLVALGWLLFGPLSVELPQTALKIEKVEDLRNYFWALGMVVAGGVAIWGLALAVVRTSALNRQAKTAETDSQLSEKKHQSEAFATAIEQLGKDNFAVRLGAVYALEALAKSSKDLHGPIFETLCAYVRSEPPGEELEDVPRPDDPNNADEWRAYHQKIAGLPPPNVVVQAILTVIGRRDPDRDPRDALIDLHGTNLRRADLQGAHLETARLNRAHLDGAALRNARLDDADLTLAHLERAGLRDAHLDGAVLMHTHLKGAILWNAHLERADLTVAHLGGADLTDAHLERAVLRNAHLERTDLSNAHLDGADLMFAHLGGADLTDAHLERAVLRNAHLERTDLSNAHLGGANLTDAHLERAVLRNAHLERTDLMRAHLDGADLDTIQFDGETRVHGVDFSDAKRIPARPGHDFRATVQGADEATWPADDDLGAWDRGDGGDDDGADT